MSAGWEVGDLAVCVNAGPLFIRGHTAYGGYGREGLLSEGRVYRVTGIFAWPHAPFLGDACLRLEGLNFYGFCLPRFRKIRPDEQSGERTDWELLLDSVNAGKVEA